jgi:hypothetical protein
MSFFLPKFYHKTVQNGERFKHLKNDQYGRTKGYSTFSKKKVLFTAEAVLLFCSKKKRKSGAF